MRLDIVDLVYAYERYERYERQMELCNRTRCNMLSLSKQATAKYDFDFVCMLSRIAYYISTFLVYKNKKL